MPEKKYIDLSILVSNNMPTFPGDPTVHIAVEGDYDQHGYIGHALSMGNHAGTHIDAPAHMLKGTRTLDTFPPNSYIGQCVYIDARSGFDLAIVQSAQINTGSIVVFDTGSADRFNDPRYFTDFPAMSSDIAEYLSSQKITMVGVDTCSIDNDPTFPNHRIFLSNNILIIENMTNVHSLKNLVATIYAFPLRLDLDAAPARVIAEVHH